MRCIAKGSVVFIFFVSCAAPRYTYYFDRHHYSLGKEGPTEAVQTLISPPNQEMLTVAAVPGEAEIFPVNLIVPEIQNIKIEGAQAAFEMNGRKTELAHEGKASIKTPLPLTTASALDRDLKLSIIFGASGIVALIIGGSIFKVIGSISLLIGLILFIKWLLRQ